MGLPAALSQLSPALAKAGVHLGGQAFGPESRGLPFGIESLDQALPDGGLLRGGVVEISSPAASGLATSLALAAVRAVQTERQSALITPLVPWCAFVDASGSLYAPGVAASGVQLSRLLVLRPPLEAVGRVALKLAESGVFSLVVVDTVGTIGKTLDGATHDFGRIVRRLSMAVDGSSKTVLLLTDSKEPRALPLPVAQRWLVARPAAGKLVVRVSKDRRGRVTSPAVIPWAEKSLPKWEDQREHARKLA
jgi:recombination protein RecA